MLSRTRRAALAVATVVALELSGLDLAWADDPPVTVTPGGGGVVDTLVTDPGSDGSVVQPASSNGSPRGAGGVQCTYTLDDGASASNDAPVVFSGGPGSLGQPGAYYTKSCTDGTVEIVWIPSGSPVPGSGPVVTPAQLAQQAYNRLRLPLPVPEFNPRRSSSAGDATLVTIPTWFWVTDWSGASQRTQAGGVWAEVTAEPVSTQWTPGDGSPPVRCPGAGVPWREGMDESASSCRYVYTKSSANQPGNRYTGRVTVAWRVTWQGAGGVGGTLPLMTRGTTFGIAVMERQTVVVGGQGSGA